MTWPLVVGRLKEGGSSQAAFELLEYLMFGVPLRVSLLQEYTRPKELLLDKGVFISLGALILPFIWGGVLCT